MFIHFFTCIFSSETFFHVVIKHIYLTFLPQLLETLKELLTETQEVKNIFYFFFKSLLTVSCPCIHKNNHRIQHFIIPTTKIQLTCVSNTQTKK